jgi:hypothetical protein
MTGRVTLLTRTHYGTGQDSAGTLGMGAAQAMDGTAVDGSRFVQVGTQ